MKLWGVSSTADMGVRGSLPAGDNGIQLYPAMESYCKYCPLDGRGSFEISDRDLARMAPTAVRDLIEDLGLPLGLSAIGISNSEKVWRLCALEWMPPAPAPQIEAVSICS